MPAIPYLIATYLVASISGPQLVARMHGIDLHRVGTRNLGASNLGRHAGTMAAITGGLIDALKPPLAILLSRSLGGDPTTVVACGVVAIVAQQWPLWHGFDGGRGNAPMFALLIALSLPAAALASLFVFAGLALAQRERRRESTVWTAGTPVGVLLGFLAYPLIASAIGAEAHVVIASSVAVALVVVRRITAGLRDDLAITDDVVRVVVNRLLYDRSEAQVRARSD